jgi:hypothetical protein
LALGVFLLPTVVVLFPTTIIMAVFMLPTIVAYSIDKLRGRPFTITVGLMNGAGSLPAILFLWSNGHTLTVAQDTLSSMIFWLIAYLCAAIGWMIYIILPQILRQYYGAITSSRVESLQKDQKKLVDQWGEDVTGLNNAGNRATQRDPNAQIDAAAEHLL